MHGAKLFGANLRGADLSWADLTGADLTMADLSGADLSWVNYNSDTKWPYGFIPPNSAGKSLISGRIKPWNARDR